MFIPEWVAQALLGLFFTFLAGLVGYLADRKNKLDARLDRLGNRLDTDTATRADFTTLRSEILTTLTRIEDRVNDRLEFLEKGHAELRVDVAVVERSMEDSSK